MHGGLPHRPGYAVVPQLEPGAVRRAIALRAERDHAAADGRTIPFASDPVTRPLSGCHAPNS